MWRFLFLVVLIAGAAAYFTKPSEEAAEAAFGQMILEGIERQDISLDKSAAGNALLIGCKLRPDDCVKVLRSQIETQYSDYTFLSTYAAQGLGFKAWCIGSFRKLTCPGGVKPE